MVGEFAIDELATGGEGDVGVTAVGGGDCFVIDSLSPDWFFYLEVIKSILTNETLIHLEVKKCLFNFFLFR